VTDVDYGARAHVAARAHLEACWDAMYAYEDEDAEPGDVVDPSLAPFCGCSDCVVREVLHGAWDIIHEAASADAWDALRKRGIERPADSS